MFFAAAEYSEIRKIKDGFKMAILQTWRDLAYGEGLNDKERENLWTGYFTIEKGIYEQILSDPTQVITGTVKELAERYNTEVLIMTGFLDGINESLKGYENPIDTMEEDTEVRIEIDPEKLYYNMVEAKANWLYELPQWDDALKILPGGRRYSCRFRISARPGREEHERTAWFALTAFAFVRNR